MRKLGNELWYSSVSRQEKEVLHVCWAAASQSRDTPKVPVAGSAWVL